MRYSRPRRVKVGLAAVLIGALVVSGTAAAADPVSPAAAAPVAGAEERVGQPFPDASGAAAPNSVHGVDANGDGLIFWMTNGTGSTPAMLQVTNVMEQEVVFTQRVPSGTMSSALAFSSADGAVYIAMTTGEFYSWAPGQPAIATIGQILPGQNIASLAVAPDGMVYAGTAPGGLVVAVDPETGATENLGRVHSDATSVTSLSVDDDYVYVGSEPNAQISRLNRSTGDVESLELPSELGPQVRAQDQSLAGDYLFVRVEPSNAAVVYDTNDLSVVNTVRDISGRPISGADPTGQYVYFRHVGSPTAVYRYDLTTHTLSNFGWAPNAFPRAFSFVELPDQELYPGYSVVMSTTNGRVYSWNHDSNRGIYLDGALLDGIPRPITALALGADGQVYAGGSGGTPDLARINLESGTVEGLSGVSRIDALSAFGNHVLIGSAGGTLRAFDSTTIWNEGTNPGEPVTIGNGQDRPVVMLPLDDQVIVGSVANAFGGAVSAWSPTTGSIDVHSDPIAQQGVVSLVERDGVLYAGTTIRGGSGGTPPTSDAHLFSIDLATGEVGFQAVPVVGATSVNGLAFDDEGTLWGIAGTELFAFDVTAQQVITHDRLFDVNPTGFGHERNIVARADGLYISADGRLLRVDPETWDAVMLADAGVERLSEGSDGHLYYSRHGQAFRWNFDQPAQLEPSVPTTTASVSPEGEGWHGESVTVTLISDDPRARIEYALNDGAWQSYAGPVEVTADGEYTLRYRSRTLSGNIERPGTVQFAIDAVAPMTTVRQHGDVLVLTARDTASGVASTHYRIDGGEWAEYTQPIRVTTEIAGSTLEFYSIDEAGNAEQARSHSVGEAGDIEDRVTNHGDQVNKVQVLASMTIQDPDGVPLGIYLVSGNPNVTGEFAVIDLRTNTPVLQTRLPVGTSSQRAMTYSAHDGAVYFGTSDVGHIYRYHPGADDVEYLAAVPGRELVWGMAAGEDGTIWFGVYSSGKLYSIDPVTLELTDHGQAAAGEQYVDAIAPHGDTIYVGTQANAKLVAYDRGTGTFTEMDMPADHSETQITSIDIRGDFMFVSTGSRIHVRNMTTGTWIDTVTGTNARVSPVSPHDANLVYLRKDAQIHSYNLETGEILPTGQRPNATPESWNWMPVNDPSQPLLMMTYWNGGRTYGFNMQGGSGSYAEPPLWGAAAPIISLGADTHGNVYSGAFLSPPGAGMFDPNTGEVTLIPGTSQIEGFGAFNDKIVMGRYPQGSLYLFDPSQPYSSGQNPGNELEIGDGQSRPQVFVQLDAETVAVASVPEPGTHGGAITLWKPESQTHEVYRHVVENQTPVALLERDGLLIGGTSIQGGYGINPVTSDATIFAWDPETRELVWQDQPIPGARFIAGFAIADDGMLWAIVDGRRVVEYNMDTREILRTITIDSSASIHRFGENDHLFFDHGRLFGVSANRLFHLDTVTEDITVLFGKESGRADGIETVHELVINAHGDLYMVGQSTDLFSYDLPDDVTAPEIQLTERTTSASGISVHLVTSDNEDDAPLIQFRTDGGAWQEAWLDVTVDVPFESTLEYRAVDWAWNASEVLVYEAPTAPDSPDPVDRSELESLISEAQSLEASDYTASSWAALLAALDNALAVVADEYADQALVDVASADLVAALAALELADSDGPGGPGDDSNGDDDTGGVDNGDDNGAGGGADRDQDDDGGLPSTGPSSTQMVVMMVLGLLFAGSAALVIVRMRSSSLTD